MPLATMEIDFLKQLIAQRSGNVISSNQDYLLESRLLPVAKSAGKTAAKPVAKPVAVKKPATKAPMKVVKVNAPSNKKPAARKGKVQLIDASSFWQKMRKSLGSKRKELSAEHIDDITRLFGNFEELTRQVDGSPVPISRIFANDAFGYHTITVERPERDAHGNVLDTIRNDQNRGLGENPVEQMVFDPRGQLWVMGDSMGLMRWRNGRFEQVPGVSRGSIYDAAWTGPDELWLARQGALERYRWDGLSMSLRRLHTPMRISRLITRTLSKCRKVPCRNIRMLLSLMMNTSAGLTNGALKNSSLLCLSG